MPTGSITTSDPSLDLNNPALITEAGLPWPLPLNTTIGCEVTAVGVGLDEESLSITQPTGTVTVVVDTGQTGRFVSDITAIFNADGTLTASVETAGEYDRIEWQIGDNGGETERIQEGSTKPEEWSTIQVGDIITTEDGDVQILPTYGEDPYFFPDGQGLKPAARFLTALYGDIAETTHADLIMHPINGVAKEQGSGEGEFPAAIPNDCTVYMSLNNGPWKIAEKRTNESGVVVIGVRLPDSLSNNDVGEVRAVIIPTVGAPKILQQDVRNIDESDKSTVDLSLRGCFVANYEIINNDFNVTSMRELVAQHGKTNLRVRHTTDAKVDIDRVYYVREPDFTFVFGSQTLPIAENVDIEYIGGNFEGGSDVIANDFAIGCIFQNCKLYWSKRSMGALKALADANGSAFVRASLTVRNKFGTLAQNPTHIFRNCEMGVPFDNTYDPAASGDAATLGITEVGQRTYDIIEAGFGFLVWMYFNDIHFTNLPQGLSNTTGRAQEVNMLYDCKVYYSAKPSQEVVNSVAYNPAAGSDIWNADLLVNSYDWYAHAEGFPWGCIGADKIMNGSGVPDPETNKWGYYFDYEENQETTEGFPTHNQMLAAKQAYESYNLFNTPNGDFVLPERNDEIIIETTTETDVDDNGNSYTYTVESVTSYPGPSEYGGNGQPSVELETLEAFIGDYKMYFATQKVNSGNFDTAGNPIQNTIIKRDSDGNPVINSITLGTYTRWKTGFSESNNSMINLPQQGIWPIWSVSGGGIDDLRDGYFAGAGSSHYRAPLFPTRDHLGNRYSSWPWKSLNGAYNPHFDTTQLFRRYVPGTALCHKVYSYGANLSRQGIFWPAFLSDGECALWDISMHSVQQVAIRAYTNTGTGQHWGPKIESYSPNNPPTTFGQPNRAKTNPHSFSYFNDSEHPASVLNGYASPDKAIEDLNQEVYSAYFGEAPIPTNESTRDALKNNQIRRVVNIDGLSSGLGFSMNPIGDWDRPNGIDGNTGQFHLQSLPDPAAYAIFYPGSDGEIMTLQDPSNGPVITGVRYRRDDAGEPDDGITRLQLTSSSSTENWPPYISVWLFNSTNGVGTWYIGERWVQTAPTTAKYTLISSTNPTATQFPSGGSNIFDYIVVNYLDAIPPSVNAYIGHWRDWDLF
jgi:hypothetical protein